MRIQDRARRECILRCPCVVCYLLEVEQTSKTDGHHLKHLPDGTILKMGDEKADDKYMIPLCQKKHHWNGVYVCMALPVFEAIAGGEPYLWRVTNEVLIPMYGDE